MKLRRLRPAVSRERAGAAVRDVLDRVGGQRSTYKPGSDLSRFDRRGGTDWFSVPADVAAVAAEARRVSERTGGALDVTVGPPVDLWGPGPRAPRWAVRHRAD